MNEYWTARVNILSRRYCGMLGAAAGCAVGVVLGTISGLVPGVHSNTVAGFLAGASGSLLVLFGPEGLAATMVTHTFLDAVPSMFLGVPDPDTVLSVLPAHRLCLAGHGEGAVRVSALGSVAGFVLCLPLFVVFMLVLPPMQGYIDWGIGLVILVTAGLLVVFSRSPG